jgi:hypothetical protein
MDSPPCIPGTVPSDLHIFRPVKKHLAGRRFAADVDVKKAVPSLLQTVDTNFPYTGIQALVPRWDMVSTRSCYVPSAAHVPCDFCNYL